VSKLIFTKGATSFQFSVGRVYPLDDPDKVNVPVDYSAGRKLYAYNKGVQEKFWNLVFDKASATDFSNLSSFFTTTVVGPASTFTLTDENGTTHTVRMMDTQLPLKEVGFGKYAGTIHLREEI
jgi:hypothetical protein